MARNASSFRLKVTWENVRDRKERENRSWNAKGGGLARIGNSAPDLTRVQSEAVVKYQSDESDVTQDIYQEEELDGAVKALMEKQRFKAALASQKIRYKQLENVLADDRRPPTLRTAAGEILQGELPRATGGGTRWLGTSSRFAGFPEDKYIGSKANEISKWCCVDRLEGLKRDRDLKNLPVRQVLRIDDDLDVNKMTGSHLKFIANPLEALEDTHGMGRLSLVQDADCPEETSEYESYTDEEEEEITPRTQFQLADQKFQAHLKKLAFNTQEEVQKKMGRVENEWRSNADNRPATLRLRR